MAWLSLYWKCFGKISVYDERQNLVKVNVQLDLLLAPYWYESNFLMFCHDRDSNKQLKTLVGSISIILNELIAAQIP